jgi:hypothetical protein
MAQFEFRSFGTLIQPIAKGECGRGIDPLEYGVSQFLTTLANTVQIPQFYQSDPSSTAIAATLVAERFVCEIN